MMIIRTLILYLSPFLDLILYLYRRRILNDFFKARHNLTLTSIATPLILGCRDHVEILDPELLEDLKEN
jgi:hypothetical protein